MVGEYPIIAKGLYGFQLLQVLLAWLHLLSWSYRCGLGIATPLTGDPHGAGANATAAPVSELAMVSLLFDFCFKYDSQIIGTGVYVVVVCLCMYM